MRHRSDKDNVRVDSQDYQRIQKHAAAHALDNIDVVAVALDAWETLEEDQRERFIGIRRHKKWERDNRRSRPHMATKGASHESR